MVNMKDLIRTASGYCIAEARYCTAALLHGRGSGGNESGCKLAVRCIAQVCMHSRGSFPQTPPFPSSPTATSLDLQPQ
eukprot:6194461-Pleurochrysis_carterae.AAC.1